MDQNPFNLETMILTSVMCIVYIYKVPYKDLKYDVTFDLWPLLQGQ